MPGVAGPRSFVAEQNARPVGLAQMRPRQEPHQWEVVYLAVEQPGGRPSRTAAGEGHDLAPFSVVPDRRAARLLGEVCDAGVQLGAERIFASIADEGRRVELFKQLGFAPVVREYIYARGPLANPGPAPTIPGLRPQQRADAYGLLQLYQRCTPKIVQMAEAKRSRSWDLPARGLRQPLARRARVTRWVVERESRKVAWLHLSRQGRGPYTVQLMVDQDAVDLGQPLLRFALAMTATSAPGILVPVREHQGGLMLALEGLDFDVLERRLIMVKQLAAPVRHHQLVPALEKVAWLHLSRQGRGPYTVQLMVDQDAVDLGEPLLRFALAMTATSAPGILVPVREHQGGLMLALEGLDFDVLERRLIMVKQLAAPVRHHQLVPALEKVV